jgi:hypothetical protein
MKRLFIIAAALNFVLGSMWLLFPELMLARWDAAAEAAAMYMGRRYGVLFLGLAVLGAIGVVTGVVGPMIWISFGLEVLLCAAFVCYFIADRRTTGA